MLWTLLQSFDRERNKTNLRIMSLDMMIILPYMDLVCCLLEWEKNHMSGAGSLLFFQASLEFKFYTKVLSMDCLVS